MLFSSMLFLWLFLPIVLVVYFISDKKFKNLILLAASLLFYAWGEPKYIVLMVLSILINYVFGILIDKYRKHAKLFLVLDILVNIGLLGYFKYFNFFASTFNGIIGSEIIALRDIALPIGISFYTFQILSYVIDLYRKEIKVQKNIISLALYVSFFPQLIAGPIVKYRDIEREINNRKVTLKLFAEGVRRFVYGLGKKVILSNTLALLVDNVLKNDAESLNTPLVWLAMLCYMLQIYFDFSGYSDMAIGLGRMFGFHFAENFNLPYLADSITDFWRRWHISLSTWFKQYIYIPLGGNRKGKARTYINLWIVFLTTGLWHGASFNFIAWGVYFGIFMVVERLFLLEKLNNNKFKLVNHIYTLFVVLIGWVLFRADSLEHAGQLLAKMFSFDFGETYVLMPSFLNGWTWIVIVMAILGSGIIQKFAEKFRVGKALKKFYDRRFEYVALVVILALCIVELVASTYNPFIYFRF